ncbi:RsmB/NOP family class I SAM-dependent RNA methyltransferase [Kiloniella laminariae]|uniref:RsmB/NOP family class I SAM-dependent RNA methyltransferase n=1 Tax=Kiloniella laminariae TaxID=454162 RepID=UPI00035EB716|nr:RsmB/NOP family class I SAM-dependent RNA methyltransferase [Kiloniella laminariae]
MADRSDPKKSGKVPSGPEKQQARKERFLTKKGSGGGQSASGKPADRSYADRSGERSGGRSAGTASDRPYNRSRDQKSGGSKTGSYTKRVETQGDEKRTSPALETRAAALRTEEERPKSGARPGRDFQRVDLPLGRLLFHIHQILENASATNSPIDRELASHFANIKGRLTDRDHSRIRDMVWGVIRRYRRLLWWLEIKGQTKQLRKLLLADLALTYNKSVADITALCRGGGGYLARLTDSEARVLSSMEGKSLAEETMPEGAMNECPPWAESGMRAVFGERFGEEAAALNGPAPLDLRVNPFKGNREDLLPRLEKAGCKAEAIDWLPNGIRVLDDPKKVHLPFYERGEIEIQDAGSQVLSVLVAVEPGQRVIDFCAGAGGKTLALAADMDNKGQLIAADVHSKRLARAAQRLKRAGVFNAERKILESERDPWVKKNKGKFDRVLIDAPCSGTGAWRRSPDSKWRRDEEDLAELVALQESILTSAARLVKPGGRLVYATCSLLPAENEEQVEKFLRSRPDFKLMPVAEIWEERMPKKMPEHIGEMLRLSPARDATDGFFAAVLVREDVVPAAVSAQEED